MIYIDPPTGKRFMCAKHCGDIVYNMDARYAGSTITQEDVPVIGPWTDYTSEGHEYVEVDNMEGTSGWIPTLTNEVKIANENLTGKKAITFIKDTILTPFSSMKKFYSQKNIKDYLIKINLKIQDQETLDKIDYIEIAFGDSESNTQYRDFYPDSTRDNKLKVGWQTLEVDLSIKLGVGGYGYTGNGGNLAEFNHVYILIKTNNASDTIDENKLIFDNIFSEETLKTNVNSRTKQMFGGMQNELQGQRAQIEYGAKIPNLTSDGKNADIYRERVKKVTKSFT